jgi:hypothetical protein
VSKPDLAKPHGRVSRSEPSRVRPDTPIGLRTAREAFAEASDVAFNARFDTGTEANEVTLLDLPAATYLRVTGNVPSAPRPAQPR